MGLSDGSWAGFLTWVHETEVTRGAFYLGVGAIMSIPLSLFGEALRRIPNWALSGKNVPPILTLAAFFGAWFVAQWLGLDVSHMVQAFGAAGLMSGRVHDSFVARHVDKLEDTGVIPPPTSRRRDKSPAGRHRGGG